MAKTATAKLDPTAKPGLIEINVVMIGLDRLKLASEVKGFKTTARKAPDNPVSFAQLKASIAHVGIIVPIVFERHAKDFIVIAGNRRVRALRELHPEGGIDIPAIDVETLPGGTPLEIAMATNVSLPQHPVDQYEIISGLIRDGMTREDAGARFALGSRQLGQVLALGGLCDEVRDAWRAGEIDAKVAAGFTLCKDLTEQTKAFAQLKKGGRIDAWSVRGRFVGRQSEIGPLVEFVTPEAYEAAGGKVNRDLFGTDHTVTDVPLAKRLAHEKLMAACEQLKGEGWAWAIETPNDTYNYSHIGGGAGKPTPGERAELQRLRDSEDDDDNERFAELESTIAARGFTAEMRAKSGCFVSINRDGKLAVDAGRVKPDEKRKVEAQQRGKTAKAKKAKAIAGGAAGIVSNALMQRMSEWLTNAAEATLAKNGDIALAVLIAGFVAQGDKAVDVEERGLRRKREGHDYAGTRKQVALDGALKAALDQSVALRITQLAAIAGASLDFQSFNAEHPPLKDKGIAAVVAALPAKTFNKAIAACFDREDYFKSVSRELIQAATTDCFGKDTKLAVKKADAVTWAVKNIPASWLPPELRSVHYEGPSRTPPAKTKAAPKAKAKKKKARK